MCSSWDRRLLGHISTVYPIYYFYEDGKNIFLLNLFIPLVNFVFLTLYFVINSKGRFYCLYCLYCLYPLFSIFKFQFKKNISHFLSEFTIDRLYFLFILILFTHNSSSSSCDIELRIEQRISNIEKNK